MHRNRYVDLHLHVLGGSMWQAAVWQPLLASGNSLLTSAAATLLLPQLPHQTGGQCEVHCCPCLVACLLADETSRWPVWEYAGKPQLSPEKSPGQETWGTFTMSCRKHFCRHTRKFEYGFNKTFNIPFFQCYLLVEHSEMKYGIIVFFFPQHGGKGSPPSQNFCNFTK